jgi:hypothetical protein
MEYVYTYVIDPITRILWLVYRTLRSVDQMAYWLLLIFVVLLLIIRMLPITAEYSIKPAYKSSNKKNDRVMYWETLIKAAEGDKYERLRLQRSLQTLSQSIEYLSFRNDQRVIFLPSCKTGLHKWVQKVSHFLQKSQFIYRKKVHSNSEMEKCIDQILKSMEMQMESTND